MNKWQDIPWNIRDILMAVLVFVFLLLAASRLMIFGADSGWIADNITAVVVAALLQAVLMTGAMYLVVFGVRRGKWAHLGFSRPFWRYWSWGILGGIAMVLLALIFAVTVTWFIDDLPEQALTGELMDIQSWQAFVAVLFVVAVIAPAAEELVFRGFVYAGLRKRIGQLPSVLLTSLCFAVVHLEFHWVHFSQILLFGVMLALLYERTRNLMVPIIAHGIYNLAIYLMLLVVGV